MFSADDLLNNFKTDRERGGGGEENIPLSVFVFFSFPLL